MASQQPDREPAPGAAPERPPHPPRPAPVVAAACVAQWLLPGAGYLVLGRLPRAAATFAGIVFAVGWGLYLGGELSRPESHQILSYLKTFACLGLGPMYLAGTRMAVVNHGRGDVTLPGFEYGNTFILAAGLMAYLLVLDVYDIAVGRKD